MAQNLTTRMYLQKLIIKLLTLGLTAFGGIVSLSVIQVNATQISASDVSDAKSQIFADYKEKQLYKKRQQAAKDLESFLAGRKIPSEGRVDFNRKLIQIGIEVLENGKVAVMSKERWNELYKTLKPDEIVDIHDPKLLAKIKEREEFMQNLENQEQVGLVNLKGPGNSDNSLKEHRDAPVIDLSVSEKEIHRAQENPDVQEEEEDEEYSVNRFNTDLSSDMYRKRVEDRANKVKNFLFYSFNSAINHHRNGKRRTIVNSYLDDTIKHYNDKVIGR